MRRGIEAGLGAALALGIAVGPAACGDSDPYSPQVVNGNLDQAADILNDGGEVIGMALDVVVIPDGGIRGEEGAYFPFVTSMEPDADLVVVDCDDQGEASFHEVDTDGAQMIAGFAEYGSGSVEPYSRGRLSPPEMARIVLGRNCDVSLRGGSFKDFGETTIAFVGTPKG